jgi:hypothetical protein
MSDAVKLPAYVDRHMPQKLDLVGRATNELGAARLAFGHLNRNPYRISHAYPFSASFKFPEMSISKDGSIVAISFSAPS